MKDSITFILPLTSQPRYHKRITAFKEAGYDCNVFSFERKYFEGNAKKLSYIPLGKLKHGSYFNRIFSMLRAMIVLIKYKDILKKTSKFYVFGFDNLMLITIIKRLLNIKTPIIYEVADIREIMLGSGIKSNFARKLEKLFIKRAALVTTTSPYYIDSYFTKELEIDKKNIFVIENKLYSPVPEPIKREPWDESRELVIGYFGLLRCQRTWDLLYELAKSNPSTVKVYIRGYLLGLDNFETRIQSTKNLIYQGEYRSPDDLAEIYNKVDISIVGNISSNTENAKLALPNRLYESLYYQVPMIAHKGTGVAKRVEELNAGWVMDFNAIEKSVLQIQKINSIEYKTKLKNTLVNKEDVLGDEDHRILIQLVNGL